MRGAWFLLAGLLALVASASPAGPAGGRYFIILFGADCGPLRLGKTHTWAAFLKVTEGPLGRDVESTTVSWLPADGTIDTLHPLRPEPGRLYTHCETARFVAAAGEKVAAFDPLEISAARYSCAMAEVERMRAGCAKYVAADAHNPGESGDARNCIVAVIRCDPLVRTLPHRWAQLGVRGTRDVWERYVATGAVARPECATWLMPAATASE